jgi:predicted adenylyl cyclase CyaB
MPANIEMKAKLRNRAFVEDVVKSLSDFGPELIFQEDTFFRCDSGRLKLRILGPNRGELIRYERANEAGPRISRYTIARSEDPQALLEILSSAVGQIGSVKKRRTLYLVGQTRVHLDEVEGLGEFLELEVVLKGGQSESEGKAIADALLSSLKIPDEDRIPVPYLELLRERHRAVMG